MNEWFVGYLLLGAVAGFFAGLLGIGGGGIMVPVLAMMFAAQGFPDAHLMHLALGTSMCAIVFTSAASLRAHHAHGAVRWPIVKSIAPGIVAGTLLGAQVAGRLPTRPLAVFFALFMAYVAVQMIANIKPKPSRGLPGPTGMFGAGLGIGGVSALAAIGGGTMSVPFMVWCNVGMREAIGTSAAIGFPIAVAGTVGYMASGHGAEGLPAGSFGFIHLPALAGTAIASIPLAPLGARAAHRLPVTTIRKVFAGVLVLLSGKMLYSLI
ncbi:MAG: sulfite exporter TauE/SafE family protein [Candidatus Nitricoxidivorans perseverans]|uniref:Probable membrane transporter protein n=1 Tax=Candidatus Nitricoxidivorans perseverans TaxID=2975601 RepID=A0AA49FJD5_9PROT|nr:MAG: sulfite exporter TauE/SafE family protein [Candidatus Nitricoxidivorans perseverans]